MQGSAGGGIELGFIQWQVHTLDEQTNFTQL